MRAMFSVFHYFVMHPYKNMSRDGSYSAADTMDSGVILPPNTPPWSQVSASHALEAGLGLVKTEDSVLHL